MIRKYQRYRRGRRWLVVLAILGCLVFHGALIGRFLLSPEQFRARTRLLLQQQFGGEVEVGASAYEFPAGVRLTDLVVFRPEERGGGELFRTKALAVDLGFLALLRGRVVVDEVVLDEPQAHITKADLTALSRPSDAPPPSPPRRVIVRGGRVVLGKDILFQGSPERELSEVHLALSEERRLANGFNFEGEAKSPLWGRCDLEGTVDLAGRRLDARVAARGIVIGERLRESIPEQFQTYAKALDAYSLAGVVDLSLETSLSWAEGDPVALKATVDLRDCSAAWERFPVRVTDIRGRVTFDRGNIYYQDITGRAGPATVRLSGQTTREKVEVHLVVRGRPLDREVYDAAPPEHKKLWDRCGIESGIINVDHQSTWWREAKRFEASIRTEVRDVRATYKPFPYPLAEVTGTVRWEKGVSYIESLRGRRGNARVSVQGQITDAGVPDLTIEASDVPFDDTLYKALSPAWQRTYAELRPEGTAAVRCTVTSADGGPDNLLYRFVIRPQGAAFQHKDFPHKITAVRGDILVDEAGTVTFRELQGRLGSIPVQFLGAVRPGKKGPELDLTVVASEVELGPEARGYLPKEWAQVYDELDPRGKVSYTWRLATDPATGAVRHSSETACLQDCSVRPKLFPVRVGGLIGSFRADEAGRITFTGMKGRIGNATVEAVSGYCAPGGVGGLNFTVRASGLALTEEIRKALPETWQKVWDELRPSGEATVEYQFTGNPAKPDSPGQRVAIEPSDATFCYRGLPLPVTEVTRGKVVFDQDANATISNVQGKVRGKLVQIGGKVATDPKGSVLHLDVLADELTLDEELRAALPQEWQEVWASLRPSGRIAAAFSGAIHLQKAEWLASRLETTLRDCEATWQKLPLRLAGLRGRFDYADGIITLTDVVGDSPVAESVRLNGRIIMQKPDAAHRVKVAVANARFVPELLAALPQDVRKAIEALELKGSADIELTIASPPKPNAPTEFSGLVRLREASFRHTYPFQHVSGDIRVDKGALSPGGALEFTGSLDLRKVAVNSFVLTDAKASLTCTRGSEGKDKAPEAKLVFGDIAASFYGGALSGKLSLALAEPLAFTSWLSLQNADFKVLSREAFGADSQATGRLHVRLEFPPGRLKAEKGLIGDGEAWVDQGELGQLPIAAGLFNALNLRSPLDRSITEADAKFGIARDQILLKEFHLIGEARVLAGYGTAGFDGALNLRLVSPRAEARNLPELVLLPLNILREQVIPQLVQVDVRGTVSQPEFHVLPVPPITGLVDEFMKAVGILRRRQPPKPAPPQ